MKISEIDKGILEDVLEIKACELREYMTKALVHAGSGHTGGSSSVLDILVGLYHGGIVKHDPENPEWEGRDRVFIAGHKAPALGVVLADLGYFGGGLEEYVNTYRDFGSKFQGHLSNTWLPGVDVSTGSLGQTISVAAAVAHDYKVRGMDNKVYVIVGDGELQEGQNWEAMMSAANYNLDNLCLIVDNNGLQIDGPTNEVMDLGFLEDKLKSFGFKTKGETIHDDETIFYDDLLKYFDFFRSTESYETEPTALILNTTKAYGFGDMENTVGSHGVVPSKEIAELAIEGFRKRSEELLDEVGTEFYSSIEWAPGKEKTSVIEIPASKIEIDLNAPEFDKFVIGEKIGTRKAYGAVLSYLANNDLVDLFVVGADLEGSTGGNAVDKIKWFDKRRHVNVGVAEQNLAGWAAGLSLEKQVDGKRRVVFASSFEVFVPGRCYDQIRNTAAYSGLSTNFVGTHAGLVTGADGATHQGLEGIALTRTIPRMQVYSPSDVVSAVKAIESAMNYYGPTYIRLSRDSTPVIYGREEAPDPHKARLFEGNGEAVANIFATGPILNEALKTQEMLAKAYKPIDVYDFNCLKPLDIETIKKVAGNGSLIFTAEDHNVINGFGAAVAEHAYVPLVHRIGVRDKFGQTGNTEQLFNKYGMSAEHIAKRVEACHKK